MGTSMSETKISVCVPAYNVEKYIKRCIESVLQQTIKNIEIIIVNDYSTDKTEKIIKKLMLDDCRIKLISHKTNTGPLVARNDAILTSKGEYIFFLDGDDELPNDALELLYDKIILSKADIVSGNIEYITNNGNHVAFGGNKLNYGNSRNQVFKSVFRREYAHNVCGKLFKAKLLKNNQYDIADNFKNGEDLYFFYQILLNAERVETLGRVVYYYYQNPASSSQKAIDDGVICNIVRTIKYKQSFISRLPGLETDIIRESTISAVELYLNPRVNRHIVKRELKNNGLIRYISDSYMIKYLKWNRLLVFMIKKYFPFIDTLYQKHMYRSDSQL